MTIPAWLDDLIWCGRGVDPAKIDWPQDPPGVLGPNTIRGWQRMMAPHNAASKYTPVRIDFSPRDYRAIKQHIERVTTDALSSGMPALSVGLQICENSFLPPSFATLHYADKRVEMVKLVDRKEPEPKICKCRGIVHHSACPMSQMT